MSKIHYNNCDISLNERSKSAFLLIQLGNVFISFPVKNKIPFLPMPSSLLMMRGIM